MSGFLSRMLGRSPAHRQVDRLYAAISTEARRPVFYADLGVPDTLDGRFDMMSLVATLVFRDLKQKGAGALAQRLTDHMFMAFDDAIRSLGVGDNGIPRRVKTMGKAYLGRAIAYDAALTSGDRDAMAEAVLRNIYRGAPPADGALSRLADWAFAASAALAAQSRAALETGELGIGAP